MNESSRPLQRLRHVFSGENSEDLFDECEKVWATENQDINEKGAEVE